MKIFNKFIWSKKEPSNKNDIWFDGSTWRMYTEEAWQSFTLPVDAADKVAKVLENASEVYQEKLNAGYGIIIEGNTISLDVSSIDINTTHNIGSIDLFEQIIAERRNHNLTQGDKDAILGGKIITTSAGNGVVPTISSNSMGENAAVLIFHFNERLYEMFVMWTDTFCYINGVLSFTKETKLYADTELSETSENAVQNKVVTEKLEEIETSIAKNTAQIGQISGDVGEVSGKLAELSAEIGTHLGTKLPYGGAAYTSFPCRLYPGMIIVSMGVSTAVYLKTKDGKSFNVYSVPYTIEEEIVAFQVNTTSEGTLIITGDYDVLKKDVASLSEKVADYDEVKEQVANTSMHFGENEIPYGGSAYTNIPCSLSNGMVIVSGGAASAVYLKTKDGKTINVYAFPYIIESDIVAFQVNTTASGVLTIKGDYDGLKNKISAIENKVFDSEKPGGHPNIPYMEFGGNLFDYQDTQILSNHYIAGDGTIREINGWSVSGYIAIETNKTYVFKCYPGFFGTSSVKNISSYAADKTFLKTIVGTLQDSYLVIANTNKEAKYVRVTINSSEIESFMFVEGDIYPSEQKRYDWIPNKYFNQSPVNALYGKIALFDGDSIAAGTEDTVLCGWSKIVGDKNSMGWHSIAVSGGTITNGVYDNGALKHPICLGVETFYSQGIHDPDYIIFEGGSNDELLGDFRDPDNLPERFGVFNEADFTGPFDNSTFCGALDYLFFKAQSLYPKTKFGFIIAQKMGKSSVGYTAKTHNRRAIFDYIIRSCRKWGIPYIDLWEEGWLNPSIPQHYDSTLDKPGNIAAGSLYTDGQHLTASGYQLISSKIEGWMKTL